MFPNRFRWVFCQLEVLRHCFPTNLRRTLEELPKSLDDTYMRILKEINNANRVHAYRLLQCLAVASRPLQVEELAEVLAFDFTGGIPVLITDWRWEDREDAVLSACSSLVSIVSDRGSWVVQFSHFSVKEFLTSDRLASCMEEVSRFHVPIEPSNVVLTKACLGVLHRLDEFTDGGSAKNIPLFQYASEYWYQHAQVGSVELETADAMDSFFDVDRPHFAAWVRMRGKHNLGMPYLEQSSADPLSVAPLCCAAGMGFRGQVKRMIVNHPQQINCLDGTFGSPLHTSVGGGHIEIAQLLSENDVDINSRTTNDWTPLHIASHLGYLKVVNWLLSRGADVNSSNKAGQTSLSLAVTNGHLDVSRILLGRNAEVNSRDDNGSTPLHFALQKGSLNAARLLLDHGAYAYVCDKLGKTPLHFAAIGGYLEVTQMLLDRNAEVNSWDDYGSTPLLCALQAGKSDVAWLLLKHGADANVRGDNATTPLHFAAADGHLEVAQILLQRNVEVNARDSQGTTPLLVSSQKGNHDVVQLLLDHNADVHMHNNNRETALHFAAACYGRLAVVSDLDDGGFALNVDKELRGSAVL
jgi:ankyrin repeat protein